jgi:site-specific recombinase XerD
MNKSTTETDLARLLQRFFAERLIQQRRVSACTIASYRDTFRLLLRFAERQLGHSAWTLRLADLDASLIAAFLLDLEEGRGNSIRTRNARLAAIHSFFHYAALELPAQLPTIQRVLAIPAKRFTRTGVGFLTRAEIEAILEAPDNDNWSGQRDRVMLAVLYNTGARVSELIAIRRKDIGGQSTRAVQLHGKGRKERAVPLWRRTSILLTGWLAHLETAPNQAVFPNRFGKPMTRSGVESRLRIATAVARRTCPSLRNKVVSPHVIRHSTAMSLLQSGVDIAVIALWLGHEDIATTHAYLEADMDMKRQVLARIESIGPDMPAWQPSDQLLAFLDAL